MENYQQQNQEFKERQSTSFDPHQVLQVPATSLNREVWIDVDGEACSEREGGHSSKYPKVLRTSPANLQVKTAGLLPTLSGIES